MIHISLFRRLLGLFEPDVVEGPSLAEEPPDSQPPAPDPSARDVPARARTVPCPYCGTAINPRPMRNRPCPNCDNAIVVRRMDGRVVYLTEAAVEIFEAASDRDLQVLAWRRQRRDWLQLARLVGVPEVRRGRIDDRPVSEASVNAARTLYLVAVERKVLAARRDKRWDDVARMRRRQAAALFDEAGATAPPSDEVVTLHQEGMVATLQEIGAFSLEVELVGATCCRRCRADDGRVFRVATELRTPRLPHPKCPRGLCACDWWPAIMTEPKERARRHKPAVQVPAPADIDPTADVEPAARPGVADDTGS